MIDKIDLDLFKKIIHEARHNPDILDSYSVNQFRAKERLINHVEKLGILNENSQIVIMGGWYGSIFLPAFRYVKKITLVDMDKEVINIATNRLFDNYTNVELICDDVFKNFKDEQYRKTDLFINTSCEHMPSMKEWGQTPKYRNPWWQRVAPTHFAFQSNNMFDIPTHNNCVRNMSEFKKQLPNLKDNLVESEIMIEDEIKDERGTRFLLIGKLK